jgi:hypothetical protein
MCRTASITFMIPRPICVSIRAPCLAIESRSRRNPGRVNRCAASAARSPVRRPNIPTSRFASGAAAADRRSARSSPGNSPPLRALPQLLHDRLVLLHRRQEPARLRGQPLQRLLVAAQRLPEVAERQLHRRHRPHDRRQPRGQRRQRAAQVQQLRQQRHRAPHQLRQRLHRHPDRGHHRRDLQHPDDLLDGDQVPAQLPQVLPERLRRPAAARERARQPVAVPRRRLRRPAHLPHLPVDVLEPLRLPPRPDVVQPVAQPLDRAVRHLRLPLHPAHRARGPVDNAEDTFHGNGHYPTASRRAPRHPHAPRTLFAWLQFAQSSW